MTTTLDVSDIVRLLRSRWRLLGAVGALAGAVGAGVLLLIPNRYRAETVFAPETRSEGLSGQLATLAAVARVSLPGTGQTQSPLFYVSVLRSRPIAYEVLQGRYPAAGLPGELGTRDSITLLEVLEPKGDTDAERLWNGLRLLQEITAVNYDSKTSILRVGVEVESPVLAAAVANRYAEALDRFNREQRRSQARARRRFTEERLTEVSRELRQLEDRLRDFLSANREYRASPRLQFEYDRLSRAASAQQDLQSDLQRQLDAARIAEVNDLPVFTVIEAAIPPQRKSWPPRTVWLAGIIAGAMGSVAAGLVLSGMRERGPEPL